MNPQLYSRLAALRAHSAGRACMLSPVSPHGVLLAQISLLGPNKRCLCYAEFACSQNLFSSQSWNQYSFLGPKYYRPESLSGGDWFAMFGDQDCLSLGVHFIHYGEPMRFEREPPKVHPQALSVRESERSDAGP
jgi:hypothetical protein